MKPTKSRYFNKSLTKKNNSIITESIFSIIILFIMGLIISNPERYSNGTISGLKLFISAVLPGLFPFMFLTKLLTELGFIFKITKKCNKISKCIFGTPGVSFFAFFMSILSGYPIGAKIISDLYEKRLISQSEAKKMSVFCTTSGPVFVVGTVGLEMFKNYKIGIIIYLSHIISSIFMGIAYHLFTKKEQLSYSDYNDFQLISKHQENLFSNCLIQTINSIFIVGAYITIFYLIAEIFESLKIISFLSNSLYFATKIFNFSLSDCKGLLYGFLEVTRGCKSLSASSTFLSIALCSGVISFSGISIMMQSMAFLKNTKIKMHSFVLTKLVHMILSIFICFIILIIFM